MEAGGVAIMAPLRDSKGKFLPPGPVTTDVDRGFNAWHAWMVRHQRAVSVDIGIFSPDVAVYAAANEFGTAKIPERSFIRATTDAETPTLQRMMDAAILRAQTIIIPLADALIPAANHLRTSIINTIQSGPPPPNAASTVKAKGFNSPLVDTGQLQRALTWRVAG